MEAEMLRNILVPRLTHRVTFFGQEIKRAYKKAALTHHPDKAGLALGACCGGKMAGRMAGRAVIRCQGGDEDKFKECGAVVETLTDERSGTAELQSCGAHVA